jgi:DNA-binding GntR family transcriptional regulator
MTEETVYDRTGRPVVVARDFYRTDHIEMLVIRNRKGKGQLWAARAEWIGH